MYSSGIAQRGTAPIGHTQYWLAACSGGAGTGGQAGQRAQRLHPLVYKTALCAGKQAAATGHHKRRHAAKWGGCRAADTTPHADGWIEVPSCRWGRWSGGRSSVGSSRANVCQQSQDGHPGHVCVPPLRWETACGKDSEQRTRGVVLPPSRYHSACRRGAARPNHASQTS